MQVCNLWHLDTLARLLRNGLTVLDTLVVGSLSSSESPCSCSRIWRKRCSVSDYRGPVHPSRLSLLGLFNGLRLLHDHLIDVGEVDPPWLVKAMYHGLVLCLDDTHILLQLRQVIVLFVGRLLARAPGLSLFLALKFFSIWLVIMILCLFFGCFGIFDDGCALQWCCLL